MFPILAFYIIRGSRNGFESMGLYIIVNDSIHLLRLLLDLETNAIFLVLPMPIYRVIRENVSLCKIFF